MIYRVPESEMEYEGDVRYFNNVPFTGIGYEVFKSGQLKSESEYKEGLEHNVCKEWYLNGQLKSMTQCKKGMKYGLEKFFYEDGEKKSESHFEWGIELDHIEWSKSGEILVERKLDSDSPESNYKILQKFRRVYGSPDD